MGTGYYVFIYAKCQNEGAFSDKMFNIGLYIEWKNIILRQES